MVESTVKRIYARGTIEQRFWAKVEKTESCWLWTGTTNGRGYGRLLAEAGRRVYPHRFSYELAHGPIPDGMVIDHTCHNPSCVNPKHLRTTTQKQNGENRNGAYRTSKSGVRGVSPHEGGRWVGSVVHNYRKYHVGVFLTVEEAEEAVKLMRRKLFTHSDMDLA